jgi:cobaltochelatase CobT
MLNSLQIVASAYGDKLGVNVIPSNYAATDGNTIKCVIDEENPEVTWGFLKHEAAHIRYSDPKLFDGKYLEGLFNLHPKLIKNGVKFDNFFSVLNALEDNRIEYKMSREYKGAFLTFDAMNAYLIKEGLWGASMTSNFQDASMQFLGFYAAGAIGGLNYPSCEELSNKCELILSSCSSPEQVAFIKQLTLDSVKSNSTMDVADLSFKCLYFLVDQMSKEQPKDGKPDDNSNGKSENVIDFDCNQKVVDKGDLISRALNNSKTKTNIAPDLHEKPTKFSSFDKEPKDRFSKGVSISGPLTNKIKHLLKAKSRSSITKSNRGRKIDKRNLSKVRMGKTNVFIKKSEGVSSNSAVYITTDISGSMRTKMNLEYTRLDGSLQALSALIKSISHYKDCDYALTTFNSSTQVIKDFGGNDKGVPAVIDTVKASGCTSICNSLVYGAKSLAAVRGKYNRNVMIVITDGKPSDYHEAKDIIKSIRDSNVDVFAFGVALDDDAESKMREMFTTHFVNLSDPDLLQQEIVKVAEIIL